MKKYEKPVIVINDDVSEGIYAASGACYSTVAKITQRIEVGRGTYVIQIDAVHNSKDNHCSNAQEIRITFNNEIEYISSDADIAFKDTARSIVLKYGYFNNPHDNIGLGNLYVTSNKGLEITNSQCIYCDSK